MRQHPHLLVVLSLFGALGLVLLVCGLPALVLVFLTTGQPSFMRTLIPLACIIGGLAGVFYVPLYAGRKLPLALRVLEVIRWELGSLAIIFLPIALGSRSSTSGILNEIFNPNLLSALHEFYLQAIFPGLLLFYVATLVKWTWEKHLMLRARLTRLRGWLRHRWQAWPRDV